MVAGTGLESESDDIEETSGVARSPVLYGFSSPVVPSSPGLFRLVAPSSCHNGATRGEAGCGQRPTVPPFILTNWPSTFAR